MRRARFYVILVLAVNISLNTTISYAFNISQLIYKIPLRFSNDNSTWTNPEPYTPVKLWRLTAGDGKKTIYVKFSDRTEA